MSCNQYLGQYLGQELGKMLENRMLFTLIFLWLPLKHQGLKAQLLRCGNCVYQKSLDR